MLTIPPSVFDRTRSEDTLWWLSQACSQTLGPPWTVGFCLDDHEDYDDEHHIYLISKKYVLEKGDKKWQSPFNKYSDNVIARWRWQKIPSIEICGDALLTRWHNPPLWAPPWQSCHYPGCARGPWRGLGWRGGLEKMYSFVAETNWDRVLGGRKGRTNMF